MGWSVSSFNPGDTAGVAAKLTAVMSDFFSLMMQESGAPKPGIWTVNSGISAPQINSFGSVNIASGFITNQMSLSRLDASSSINARTANITNSFTALTFSLQANPKGHCYLQNGLLLQWGTDSLGANAAKSVPLQIAFGASPPLNIAITDISSGLGGVNALAVDQRSTNATAIFFTNSRNGAGVYFMWSALGLGV